MMRASMVRGLLAAMAAGLVGAAAARAATVKITYETSGHSEQVSVIDADGSGRHQLGPGMQPLISPNGELVAAGGYGVHGRSLGLYSITGAPARGYVNAARTLAVPLAWSPDSRYLAIQLTDTSASQKVRTSGVAVVDTAKGTIKRVAAGFVQGASFDPTRGAGDRLVYGLSAHQAFTASTDLYTIRPDGTARTRLTHDGRSLDPVWSARGIAFDRERLRGTDNAPAYDIWRMRPDGSHPTQITHVAAPNLIDGLVPTAFSASGNRMIAEYVGEDTNEAYTVSVPGHQAHRLTAAHHGSIEAGGISRDGRTLLVTLDAFENPTSAGKVATMPFGGGTPRILVQHAGFATWNG